MTYIKDGCVSFAYVIYNAKIFSFNSIPLFTKKNSWSFSNTYVAPIKLTLRREKMEVMIHIHIGIHINALQSDRMLPLGISLSSSFVSSNMSNLQLPRRLLK